MTSIHPTTSATVSQSRQPNDVSPCCKGRIITTQYASNIHRLYGVKAAADATVGRCRLIVSQPELKARLVSALETKM